MPRKKVGDIIHIAPDGHKTTVVFAGNDFVVSRCCHGDEFVFKHEDFKEEEEEEENAVH